MLDSKQIAFFKKALEDKRVKIIANLNSTSTEMNSSINSKPKDEGDHASFFTGHSVGNAILNKQSQKLVEIDRSLKRIEEDCYGICNLCGESINIERLKVKIFADYCISCRELVEKRIV